MSKQTLELGIRRVTKRSKSQVRNIRGTLFALLGCITIIFMAGCSDPFEVALETTDGDKGERLVEKISDQKALARVALEANHWRVRRQAVWNLTDQSALARVALEDKDTSVRKEAIKSLTDQAVLAKIALEDESDFVREAAIKKLNDQTVLAKIAIEDGNPSVRRKAFQSLIDLTLSAKSTDKKEDKGVQLIQKVIRAFDNVPDRDRARLMDGISPAIRVLSDPEVENVLGEIVSINTRWSRMSVNYAPLGIMYGESFLCSIKLKNLTEPLSHSWSSDFPPWTSSLSFQTASVNAGDLLEPAFEVLSHPVLRRIALEDEDEDVREAAVKKLNDQDLLANIAIKDEGKYVRRAAVKKLNDQDLLVKISFDDKHGVVRKAAVERLDVLRSSGKKK